MGLLDLPIELLLSVISLTIPESIESIALTCHTTYKASQTFLPEHNRLRRHYRCFRYDVTSFGFGRGDENPSQDIIRSSLELLVRIAANPLIARYIISGDFRNDVPGDDEHAGVRTAQNLAANNGAGKSRLINFLEKSPYLQDIGWSPSDFLDKLINEYVEQEPCILASILLLTLLPNIEELAPPAQWANFPNPDYERSHPEDPSPCWRMMDMIVARARDDSNAAMANLTTLRPMMRPGYDNRVGLQAMSPLLSIPRVTAIYAGSCVAVDDNYTGKRFERRYPSFGASLERVELAGCCVDDVQMAKFLSGCPKLRIFKLSYETKWHGCGHDWDVGHFIRAVEETTYAELEELSVSILRCYGSTGTGVVSMKRFEKLKIVELGLQCFAGPPCGGEIDQEWDYNEHGSTAVGDSQIPSLLELLPETVESLVLLDDHGNGGETLSCLERLFAGLDEKSRMERLPNLQDIEIRLTSESMKNVVGGDASPQPPRWRKLLQILTANHGKIVNFEDKGLGFMPEVHRAHTHGDW